MGRKNNSRKTPAENPVVDADAKPTEEPGVLVEKLRDVWDRHVSGKEKLPRPAAEFVGQVVDGEVKLIGKALDKALDILEGRRNGAAPKRLQVKQEVEARNLAVDDIAPSPYQVRNEFPKEEIRSLADSIEAQGQILPVVVRRADGFVHETPTHYELVDGERRWRAVCLLGWSTIRAEVQEHTDAQARAIVLASSIQRKDLNAIERARACRQAIEAGDAKGPTELARQLGLAQGTVSNLLRLLDLPEQWQRRVISGEMTERHARAIVAWKDYPAIMERIERLTEGLGSQGPGYERHGHGSPWVFADHTVDEFQEEILRVAVEDCTRPVDGPAANRRYYDARRGAEVPIFEPTEEQAKELQIVTHNEERRAANVELWDRLQDAFLERREGQVIDAEFKVTDDKPKKKSASKPDAAEQARQYAQRLYEFQLDWLCWLIADQLRHRASESEVMAVLAFGAGLSAASDGFDAECLAHGIKPRRHKSSDEVGVCGALTLVALLGAPVGRAAALVAGGVASQAFWDCEANRAVKMLDGQSLVEVAAALGIECEEAWGSELAGPLTERYWNLHTAVQLYALGKQLGVTGKLPVAAKKADLVKAFLDLMPSGENHHEAPPLPKELAKVRRPK